MIDIRREIIRLGELLDAEQNAASDLWSWLPSHEVAVKFHGDYADRYCPSVTSVMTEAAMYIAHLKQPSEPLDDETQCYFNNCPCGEDHQP